MSGRRDKYLERKPAKRAWFSIRNQGVEQCGFWMNNAVLTLDGSPIGLKSSRGGATNQANGRRISGAAAAGRVRYEVVELGETPAEMRKFGRRSA
jgi:hypothetical protein